METMPARRPRFRPARLFAILTALLSSVIAIVWIDSYRPFPTPPLTPKQLAYNDRFPDRAPWKPYPPKMVGWGRTFELGGQSRLRIRTGLGSFLLCIEWRIADGTPDVRNLHRWHGFGYEHWVSSSNSRWVWNGTQALDGTYRALMIGSPFWALLLLCVGYSTIYFLRGPLRRRKRRHRGQCLECGYDLRGSAGKCPECGADVFGPRESCAAGVAGASEPVIESESEQKRGGS